MRLAVVALVVVVASSCARPGDSPEPGCEDADGDGFASHWCGGADCCDVDGDAFPGQDEAFAAESACHGWDYDCNGVEAPAFVEIESACQAGVDSCLGNGGWTNGVVPACGESADWSADCSAFPECASLTHGPRAQACR